jgi:hypothetical protein
MRTWLAGLLLVASSVGSALAAGPQEFAVTGYKLAFVNVDKFGAITNEYVPKGQTLENWKTLIGVRVWPKIEELKEVTGPYLQQLEPVMVREAKVYEPEGSKPGTDVVFELYLAPADKSYLEYNLIRFVKESGTPGVKSYQFAERRAYDVDAAVKIYEERRETWLGAIAGLVLTAETEAIAVTTEESLSSESTEENATEEEATDTEEADEDDSDEDEAEEADDDAEEDGEEDEDAMDEDGDEDDDADEDDDEDDAEEEEEEEEDEDEDEDDDEDDSDDDE